MKRMIFMRAKIMECEEKYLMLVIRNFLRINFGYLYAVKNPLHEK
jgi:hypothetical protein